MIEPLANRVKAKLRINRVHASRRHSLTLATASIHLYDSTVDQKEKCVQAAVGGVSLMTSKCTRGAAKKTCQLIRERWGRSRKALRCLPARQVCRPTKRSMSSFRARPASLAVDVRPRDSRSDVASLATSMSQRPRRSANSDSHSENNASMAASSRSPMAACASSNSDSNVLNKSRSFRV